MSVSLCVALPMLHFSFQSLEDELSRLHADVEAGKERVKELEMMVGDKEEQVRIVEKKSNGLVRIV